jgi:Protein kinase domain
MNGGAEIAAGSDHAGHHAPGELIAGKYTLLHPLDAQSGSWLARSEADRGQPKTIFALQLLRFPPDRAGAHAAFDQELRKVETLRHPNLLCPLDYGAHGERELYVGYEWVRAKTLAQTLREEWPLSDERVVSIMTQLLRALAAVHAAGMTHGDVKPSNVLLVPTPRRSTRDPRERDLRQPKPPETSAHVLLRGLGLSEFSPYRSEETPPEELAEIMAEWVVGDPDYAAPEQLMGELPSARSDLYAAGILLFQLLTRTVPFTAISAHEVAFMQRFTPPEPPSAYALVNPTLEAICLRALSKTPDLRFQTASEMHAALFDALPEPNAGTGGGAAIAFERARAQLARVSSVALAPAMRASSAAIAPVARASSAALGRARVHVARVSHAALVPITRAGSATLPPSFRADALSGAPVETAVAERAHRSWLPLIALCSLGAFSALATHFWLERSSTDSDAAAPVAAASRTLASDDAMRATPVAERVSAPLALPMPSPPAPGPSPIAQLALPAADALDPTDEPETPAASPLPSAEGLTPTAEPSTSTTASTALAAATAAAITHEADLDSPADPAVTTTDSSQQPERAAASATPRRPARAPSPSAAGRDAGDLGPSARPSVQLTVAPPRPSAAPASAPAPNPGAPARATAPVASANLVALAAPPAVSTSAPRIEAHTVFGAPVARPAPPPAAKPAGTYRVELGEPVASRRSVSKGALRGALKPDVLARCYRDTLAPGAMPSALRATLELTTDLSGRVRSAHLRGSELEPELVQCVEAHARRSRVREGDSGGAMQAAIALTFRAL